MHIFVRFLGRVDPTHPYIITTTLVSTTFAGVIASILEARAVVQTNADCRMPNAAVVGLQVGYDNVQFLLCCHLSSISTSFFTSTAIRSPNKNEWLA